MPTYAVVNGENPGPLQHPAITLVGTDGAPWDASEAIPPGTFAETPDGEPMVAAAREALETEMADRLAGLPGISVKTWAATDAQREVVGNGLSKPLSGFYGSLAEAQVDYPLAASLTAELDRVVINKAIAVGQAYAAAVGSAHVKAPHGTYVTDEELVVTQDNMTIDLRGATIKSEHTGIGFRIGQDGARTQWVIVLGGTIKRTTKNYASGSVALQFRNANFSRWVDGVIEGWFEIGHNFIATTGEGCAYNVIYPTRFARCKFGIAHTTDADPSSWCNDNKVFGGYVTHSVSDPDTTGGYNIYLNGNTPGNNAYIGVVLETVQITAGSASGAIYDNGGNNVYGPGMRYEGAGNSWGGSGSAGRFIVLGPDYVKGSRFIGGASMRGQSSIDATLANPAASIRIEGEHGNLLKGGGGEGIWKEPLLELWQIGDNLSEQIVSKNIAGNKTFSLTSKGEMSFAGGLHEGVSPLVDAGANPVLSFAAGTWQERTLNSNAASFTFSGAIAGRSSSITLLLKQRAAGNATASFPGVKWAGGTPPTMPAAANAEMILTFVVSGGGVIYGAHVGSSFA